VGCEVLGLNTKLHLNYISRFSWHRAVNELKLLQIQSVVLYGKQGRRQHVRASVQTKNFLHPPTVGGRVVLAKSLYIKPKTESQLQ
jgi:hypothetical protein